MNFLEIIVTLIIRYIKIKMVDIAFNNPDNLNVCTVLISELAKRLSKKAMIGLIESIQNKFSDIPNT